MQTTESIMHNAPALPTTAPLDFNPKESPWSRPDPRGNFGGPLKAICLKATMKVL